MFRVEDKKRRQKESGQAAFVSNVCYTCVSVTAQIGRSQILLIDLPQPSAWSEILILQQLSLLKQSTIMQ